MTLEQPAQGVGLAFDADELGLDPEEEFDA